MPNPSRLKTMSRKLWGFLLGEESRLCTVTFGALGLIILIVLANNWLRGTRFDGFWALYLVLYVILAVYIYLAFRVFVWLRNFKRGLPTHIQRIKDDINGKIRPKTPEMEAAEAVNTALTRTMHLVIGLILLATAIPDNPMLVSLSFAVGLLGAFLMCGRDCRAGSHETRTIEIGRLVFFGIRSKVHPHEVGARIFVIAMTAYVVLFLDTDVTLQGWVSGFICGFATFNDNWQSLIAQWPTLKKEIRSFASIKKSLGKKD